MPHALPSVRRTHSLVVGNPSHWGRDLALVGAATASLAPFLVIFDPGFCIGAGAFGGASGWMLGRYGSVAIDRLRGWMPLTAMIFVAPLVGIAWGAASGGFGGLFAAHGFDGDSAVGLGMLFGGVAGGLQLGALFVPYLVTSTVGGPRWPVVAAALLAAPLLGWGSLFALVMMAMLWPVGIMTVPAAGVLMLWFERMSKERSKG